MRVLICGSRDWQDEKLVEREVRALPADAVIIHGGAMGADLLAGKYAKLTGRKVAVFLAEWNRFGRSAGPIRNKRMLVEGKPDLVIAFWRDGSRGTKNMIDLARAANVEVRIHYEGKEGQ